MTIDGEIYTQYFYINLTNIEMRNSKKIAIKDNPNHPPA